MTSRLPAWTSYALAPAAAAAATWSEGPLVWLRIALLAFAASQLLGDAAPDDQSRRFLPLLPVLAAGLGVEHLSWQLLETVALLCVSMAFVTHRTVAGRGVALWFMVFPVLERLI